MDILNQFIQDIPWRTILKAGAWLTITIILIFLIKIFTNSIEKKLLTKSEETGE